MSKIIYLLEADDDIRMIMQYILEEEGYTVKITDSIDLAMNISSCKPDLILLDDMVAKRDPVYSVNLTAYKLARVPLIVTTTAMDRERVALEMGADDILTKPFDIEDLVSKIAHWTTKAVGS